jgi:hypothetical protein
LPPASPFWGNPGLSSQTVHRIGYTSLGEKLSWDDIIQDLERLHYAEVEQDGKRFLLRTEAQGSCSKVFAAAGVALPPTVQQLETP